MMFYKRLEELGFVWPAGRGKTKTGWLWALARDDRSWGGTDPPGVVYFYPRSHRCRSS